jgi:large subunit ribosomal protein L16
MMPERVKSAKASAGRKNGQSHPAAIRWRFGEYGLQSLEPAWVTARQIEAGVSPARNFLRREGRLFIRIFPAKRGCRGSRLNAHGQGQGRSLNSGALS